MKSKLKPPLTQALDKAARDQLSSMGPVSDDEKIFGAVMMCVPVRFELLSFTLRLHVGTIYRVWGPMYLWT